MQAIIYQPTKTAMQSAPIKDRKWLLEFRSYNIKQLNSNLININNFQTQNKLYFNSKDQAIEYAKMHQLDFDLIE
jgi:hypothetical protein